MLFEEIANTSARLGETRARRAKVALLRECLRRLGPAERAIGAAFLTGRPRQGRIGVGPALVEQLSHASPAERASLSLRQVDEALEQLTKIAGPGSAARRTEHLGALAHQATAVEQRFLARLLLGELRQGALEGVLLEALAEAAELPLGELRRAVMLAGDLPSVAEAALGEGRPGLGRFRMQLLRPVQPMLAQAAEDIDDALGRLGEAALEFKLDGARVQVHKADDEVRVYTRRLNEVTSAVPELVERVGALPVRELVLDGEALAVHPDGRPHPFQTTMRRFGRRLDVESLRAELPLAVFFFDLLYRDGEELIDRPGGERWRILSESLPAALCVPHMVTAAPEEARSFLQRALSAGHEGVMAKSLGAIYEAGNRGTGWLKVKQVHTLDLVVLAAEWGSGRRQGWLSNLHLGARDPAGGFVMLGKTFKGLTDEMLAWQTQRLLELELGREGHTVHVRPELVVEIAFNELQASPQYPGGLALRFARVRHYRTDKGPQQADTIATVRALYARQIAHATGQGLA